MRVLVVNAGSSSLKVRLLDVDDQVIGTSDMPADASGFDTSKLSDVLAAWGTPDAVGHRVVHGGTYFAGPALLTDDVEKQLESLTELAPLHQPKSLAGIRAVGAALPSVPAVACFDTAFHQTMPAHAVTYAVPEEWRSRFGVRRYGFHGLSHAYCAARSAELAGVPETGLRVISAHLGAGASLAAIVDGRSVDTTMGFTPLEGLVMATRSGTIDPALVLWLQEHAGLSTDDVSTALEKRSGLTALCGTGDLREVESRASAGDSQAEMALDVYAYRVATHVGAMAAAAGGADVLSFTGGVGEHSTVVRSRVARYLDWLGVSVNDAANESVKGDADISASGAVVRTLVIEAREDLEIARETRSVLA